MCFFKRFCCFQVKLYKDISLTIFFFSLRNIHYLCEKQVYCKASLCIRLTNIWGKIMLEISGNYYDYASIQLLSADYGLQGDLYTITGSATRVIKVMDNAATWVSKSTARKMSMMLLASCLENTLCLSQSKSR